MSLAAGIEAGDTIRERIIEHWRELLGIERVAPQDHFIHIGGNSLLATMLANRLEEELGVRPELTELFGTLDDVVAVYENLVRPKEA